MVSDVRLGKVSVGSKGRGKASTIEFFVKDYINKRTRPHMVFSKATNLKSMFLDFHRELMRFSKTHALAIV